MPSWDFRVVAGPYAFTEGPVWDGHGVLFSDIPTSRTVRYDAASKTCDVFLEHTNGGNGLALDARGRLYVCEGSGRALTRHEADGTRTILAERYEGCRLNSPNDLVLGARGRIWFTDPRYGDRTSMELDHESVYRLDERADGTYALTRASFDTIRPNGLALSPDGRTLYVADSPPAPQGTRRLLAYRVRDDGALDAVRVLHDFGPHRGIDGMTVDSTGAIVATCGWATSGPGPRVAVFAAEGRLLAEHAVPAEPTNCCFGGPDMRTLYVTAKDGRLYGAHTDHRGLQGLSSS